VDTEKIVLPKILETSRKLDKGFGSIGNYRYEKEIIGNRKTREMESESSLVLTRHSLARPGLSCGSDMGDLPSIANVYFDSGISTLSSVAIVLSPAIEIFLEASQIVYDATQHMV